MSVIVSPPRMPSDDRRDDAERAARPSGQGLFEGSADLLAAARAVAAHAGAHDSGVALGPALACIEASLEALAEAARRIGVEDCATGPAESITRSTAAGRFERFADALVVAAAACGDARRTRSTGG